MLFGHFLMREFVLHLTKLDELILSLMYNSIHYIYNVRIGCRICNKVPKFKIRVSFAVLYDLCDEAS